VEDTRIIFAVSKILACAMKIFEVEMKYLSRDRVVSKFLLHFDVESCFEPDEPNHVTNSNNYNMLIIACSLRIHLLLPGVSLVIQLR
jgi:hypothetical protein